MKPLLNIAGGSIAVSLLVLALKFSAARVSGSTALFSDALEAMVNVVSASLALYALFTAAKPADREHPYGHAKAELLSAMATGALILIAASLIFERSFNAIGHPAPLAPLSGRLGLGLACNAAAGGVNALWALALFRLGRNSPALRADGVHLFADVLTTIGIVLALALAGLLHLPILDPLIAIGIAIQIAFMGIHTVMHAMSGLMDEAPPPDVAARIQDVVQLHAQGAIEAHDFRMRQAGIASFLEFHLVVPGTLSVASAHDICDRIETALQNEMEGVCITIHVEPHGKAKNEGVVLEHA